MHEPIRVQAASTLDRLLQLKGLTLIQSRRRQATNLTVYQCSVNGCKETLTGMSSRFVLANVVAAQEGTKGK
jgi:hypothetical protein